MYIFLNLNDLYSIYLFIYIIIEQFRFHHFKDLDGVEYMLNNLVFTSFYIIRISLTSFVKTQKNNICLRQY